MNVLKDAFIEGGEEGAVLVGAVKYSFWFVVCTTLLVAIGQSSSLKHGLMRLVVAELVILLFLFVKVLVTIISGLRRASKGALADYEKEITHVTVYRIVTIAIWFGCAFVLYSFFYAPA